MKKYQFKKLAKRKKIVMKRMGIKIDRKKTLWMIKLYIKNNLKNDSKKINSNQKNKDQI
jgi:hypothetical protein